MTEKQSIPKIFGTDGVRGHANTPPMSVEIALALGRAVGKILSQGAGQGKKRIIVGKDTRLSCYMFENALIAGLCSMGVDTWMLGPFPTPGVAFLTRAYRADAGVVISASHNPFFDNGIKFFSSEGYKFPDSWESEVEKIVFHNKFEDALPLDSDIGRNSRVRDADGRYVEFCKATFPRKLTLRNLKIVLDCANGAAYKVAPLVFQELDAELHIFGCAPNGININENSGSLFPANIQKGVIDHQADVGIALDGDGDRLIMVDENSQIVDGDKILGICALDLKKRGLLSNDVVVSTVMANLGFVKTMEDAGIRVVRSAVGDRYVIQEMVAEGAILGGEQSGHLLFLDHNTTGDGIVSALQVLRIMIETDSKLSDLVAAITQYPQALMNIRVKSKPPLEGLSATQEAIKNAETQLGKQGTVLVRYSGTEPILRVTIQCPKQKLANEIAALICKTAKQEINGT